ncbi:MAG: purine phosphorylase [Alphaproteobacteria bacterium]
MNRLGILTGFRVEARLLRALPGHAPLVACSGADAERARAMARDLVERGAKALVSFGLAGGLAEGLAAGTLLLPSEIRLHDGSLAAVDPTWRAKTLERMNGLHPSGGCMACAPLVLATRADKQALAERSSAVAADMESEAVAVAAQRAGLPFLVLRAVADPWDAGVPPPILAALATTGSLRFFAAAVELLRHPGQLPALLRLARDGHEALTALRTALNQLDSLEPP